VPLAKKGNVLFGMMARNNKMVGVAEGQW